MKSWIILALFLIPFDSYSFELYLTRHFEKQADIPNPELTEQGKKRAIALAEFIAGKNIAHIYSTDYLRTKQTVEPAIQQLELSMSLYDPKQLVDFASELLSKKQTALVVGHSNTTPELISLLGGKATKMTENDYGELFILRISGSHITTDKILIEAK